MPQGRDSRPMRSARAAVRTRARKVPLREQRGPKAERRDVDTHAPVPPAPRGASDPDSLIASRCVGSRG